MDQMKRAYDLLNEWKGDAYIHGLGVLDKVGEAAAKFGKKALVVSNTTYMKPVADRVVESLKKAGVELAGGVIAPEAKPNAPREDVYRLESHILHTQPDSIVVIGGGSAIDAIKASNALAALGGKVTLRLITTSAPVLSPMNLLHRSKVDSNHCSHDQCFQWFHLTKY